MFAGDLSTAAHLDRLERAGLTVVEYAKRNGISPSRLYKQRWRQRKNSSRSIVCDAHPRSSRNTALTFTQISPPQPQSFSLQSTEIQLAFPDGIRAILPSGFSAADLQNVVSVLTGSTAPRVAC